jgi:hypothetical protein
VEACSDETIPRFLYRYRAFRDRYDSLRKILVENHWYFGSRREFDDQRDCVVPGVVIDRDHLERIVRSNDENPKTEREQQLEQFLADPGAERKVTAAVQGYIDEVGILCLSELDDNSKLWGLYADDGRGVCLCLDMTKIIHTEYYRLRGPFQVKYDDGPKQPWDPRANGDQIAQTEDHLLRKRREWEYQKEWRFILHRNKECTVGEHSMPIDSLYAVILGRRLALDECRQVSKWIRLGPWKPSPKLYCCDVAQNPYLL